MSKRVQIKCTQCGEWRMIKVMNGAKMKKICNQCLHPELYREEEVF